MSPAPVDLDRLTALAPPGHLVDWRLAVAWEAAWSTGLVEALPGTVDQLADRAELEPGPLRAVVSLLAQWGLVSERPDGVWSLGPRELTAVQARALAQHGVWIRRWSNLCGPRLRERGTVEAAATCRPGTAEGLRLLAEASAPAIVPVVDVCLRLAPGARQVLDLGGGHGEYSLELARRGAQVTLQDLPGAIDLVRGDHRFEGVRLHAQNAFDGIAPGPYDLVLCCTVTNMFDGAANADLLCRAGEQLAPGGVLAVVTYMRDRGPVGAVFGVQMVVATDGGDAHSSTEHRDWLATAGLVEPTVVDIEAPPLTVVAARAPGVDPGQALKV